MVDPDGRAFYVKLGEAGVEIPSIETKVIATTVDAKSGAVELSKEAVSYTHLDVYKRQGICFAVDGRWGYMRSM